MQFYVLLFESTLVIFTQFPEAGKSSKDWTGHSSKRGQKCTDKDAEKEAGEEG